MLRHSLPVGAFTIASGLLLAGAAAAQAGVETWVSGTGANTGTCPITAPCRTFAYAFTQTSAGGAINVVSSGNFGPLTITKSVSIVASGVEAIITSAANGAAVVVQGSGDTVVSLRGLIIDLRGTANNGISFVSGAALHVDNIVIRKTTSGIRFAPASGSSELYISNSVIESPSDTGINVLPTGSAGVRVSINRVRVENGGHGISFRGDLTTGSVTGTVIDSGVSGGIGTGISAVESGSGTTSVLVDRSTFANNFHGVGASGAAATIRIGDSAVTGNVGSGFFAGTGVIASYETNKVNGNGTDGTPTSVVSLK